MLVGTVALLVFGLPLRLILLVPAMVVGSGLMLWVWSGTTPPPGHVALLQVAEWLAVVNLLGAAVVRMMGLTLRGQFALGQALRHLATRMTG